MGDRLADARIDELLVVLVEHGDAVVGDQPALDLELGVLLDGRHLVGRHVADELVFAGQQAVDAARDFGNDDEAQRLDRRPAAPVVVVRIEHQALVGPELAHLVGAGRHRLARPFDPVLGLHEAAPADDLAGRAGEAALQGHVGHAVDETHRVAVDRLDLVERRPDALGDADDFGRQRLALDAVARHHGGEQGLARGRVGARAEHALRTEGEHHVVGVHLVAVVELHALAQGQFDRALVDAPPALGQPGHRLELALQVAGDEVLEDRRLHALADIGALAHDLEIGAGRDLLDGDGNHRPVVGLSDGEARQHKAAGGEAARREELPTIQARHSSSRRKARLFPCYWANLTAFPKTVSSNAVRRGTRWYYTPHMSLE